MSASASTLEAGPSAIVGGCVNVMTGGFFDSGIDLILPGAQPLMVQHTFCDLVDCHFSHKPCLEMSLSPHQNSLLAVYTDDNGSAIPYKALFKEKRVEKGFLQITDEARAHLTNYSSAEISGRTRWANSRLYFVKNDNQKQYRLYLGSGIKRVFERNKKGKKPHGAGAHLGQFHLVDEKNPNGNRYLYSYDDHDHLLKVKAVNKNKQLLGQLTCEHHAYSNAEKFERMTWTIGNKSVQYIWNLTKTAFSIRPSHGISTSYEADDLLAINKFQADKRILRVQFSPLGFTRIRAGNQSFVSTLLAPAGETDALVPIYRFKYSTGHEGYTIGSNAYNWKSEYRYNKKYKRLESIRTYDENDQHFCTESFYWNKPRNPYKQSPTTPRNLAYYTYIPSEHLLVSKVFEEKGHLHFCRHMEYDHFGNITKSHLWGNLTGRNRQPIVLKEGIPIDNGCEVYSKVMESSQNGLNLPLYENDGRKWVRQTYYPGTNLLEKRFTGTGQTILKREFFQYDDNAILIEEIWDDGTGEEKTDLMGATERHLKLITPRTEIPIGLPQVIHEFYYDFGDNTYHLIKKIVNIHSSEGELHSQEHYGSNWEHAYTLYWKYDHIGNIIKETNAMGEKIRRKFDKYGNKIEEQGARKDVYTTFEYDCANRLIKENEIWEDGSTFTTTHRYNLLSQKIATVDPYEQETLFFYDRLGHLTKTVTSPIQTKEGEWIHPTIETLYNAMGQAIATCDANGQWTKMHYTIRGQPYRIEYPDGSLEQKEYSLDGLLEKEVAKNGLITRFVHDAFGRIISTATYSPENVLLTISSATYSTFRLLTETDEAGNITHYTYDGAGRRIAVTKGNKTTKYFYDSLGRVIKEVVGDSVTLRKYDNLDRILDEQIENSSGQIQTKKEYKYDCNGNRTHEILYTQAGVAVQETLYNPHNDPIMIVDALGNRTYFVYGKIQHRGQIVRSLIQTDPLGFNEVKIFDTHNHVSRTWRSNPLRQIVQLEDHFYDANGHPLQSVVEVYVGNSSTRTVTTEWEYDRMGNMIHCIEAKGAPEQKSYSLSYNSNGEKEFIIKPNGVVLHHQYDLFGRLERFSSSDNTIDYFYIYDLNDNLVRIEDKVHDTATARMYDQHDRLISEILETGLTFSYTYNELDRPLIITLPDQSAIQYHYNGQHLIRIDRIQNNQVSYSHHYTEYDSAGNLLRVDLPGEAGSIACKYDLLQRTISLEAPHWKENIPKNGYDAAGNLLHRQVLDPQGAITYDYTYDALYQLASEQGHLSHLYTNDSLYNRIAKDNQHYQVNDLNQLLQQTDSVYSYDANGNLISLNQGGKITTYSYDALDRLVQIVQGDSTTNYQYDSFHRRTSKTHLGCTTLYLYIKENEIGSVENQRLKELRILGLGKGAEIGAAVAIELEGTSYIPIHDPYGNVTTLLDLNGNLVAHYRYTAFGEEETYGLPTNPWRYSSKRVDPETTFIYFGRRYYMPSIGRWLTPDPIGFADGPNLYTYVHNHPLTMVDPDGQLAWFIPMALWLAVDYCMPAATLYLSQYAGGAIAASVATGFISGYNDPLSSAVDPGTYSMGDADMTSFVCNRAAMAVGAAVACKQAVTKCATNVVSAAGREITSYALGKAETAVVRSVTTGLKNSAKTAGQKTSQAAKHYLGKGGVTEAAKKAGRKRFVPDGTATGTHTVFRRDPLIKKVTHYETFQLQTNPRNPNMWESVVRFDNSVVPPGKIIPSHYNKVLDRRIYEPHVHDPLFPGGIRDALLKEIP